MSQSCVPESGLPSQRNGSRPPHAHLPPPLTGALATTDSKAARLPSPWIHLALPLLTNPPFESGSRIIKRYLAQGGNLDDVLRTSYCAIGMAVDEGSEWAFDVLRTSGASLRFSADRPDFLIFAAAASRNLSLAQRLIEEFGFDVNASDTCGSTPYIVALGCWRCGLWQHCSRGIGGRHDCLHRGWADRPSILPPGAGGLVEVVRRTFLEQRGRDELGTADASLMDVAVKSGQRAIIALSAGVRHGRSAA